MKFLRKYSPEQYVELEGNLLYIYEGSNYYDTRVTFEVDAIRKLEEEVGVRGGHVGWTLKYFESNKDYEYYDEPLTSFDFGRKLKWAMDIVKNLIIEGKIKADIIILMDQPTKCY